MKATTLLQLPEGMRLDQSQITENGLVLEVVATHPTSWCPLCVSTIFIDPLPLSANAP